MKAITIQQPWAQLIAIGAKSIETRSWRTDYRGPLAIHAAKGMPDYARDAGSSFGDVLREHGYTTRTPLKLYKTWNGEKWLPAGAVVAVCELVDCVKVPDSPITEHCYYSQPGVGKTLYAVIPPPEPELSYGDYTPGRWAWLLAFVRAIEPVPAKGDLGLWDWTPEGEVRYA